MKSWLLSLALFSVLGCKKETPEPTFARQKPARSEQTATVSDAAASALPDAGTEAAVAAGADGGMWTHFSHKDDTPLCAFGDWEAWNEVKFLKDVPKSVRIKADEHITFATYSPECASRDCVDRPTIQCWVDMDGNDITVHTRYSGERRGDPSMCQVNCQEVTGSCMTPVLAAGTYQVHYGARTRKIKVPSLLRPACMPLE